MTKRTLLLGSHCHSYWYINIAVSYDLSFADLFPILSNFEMVGFSKLVIPNLLSASISLSMSYNQVLMPFLYNEEQL